MEYLERKHTDSQEGHSWELNQQLGDNKKWGKVSQDLFASCVVLWFHVVAV